MRTMDVEPEVMVESIKDITKLDEKDITSIVQEVLQFDDELVNSADAFKKIQAGQDASYSAGSDSANTSDVDKDNEDDTKKRNDDTNTSP